MSISALSSLLAINLEILASLSRGSITGAGALAPTHCLQTCRGKLESQAALFDDTVIPFMTSTNLLRAPGSRWFGSYLGERSHSPVICVTCDSSREYIVAAQVVAGSDNVIRRHVRAITTIFNFTADCTCAMSAQRRSVHLPRTTHGICIMETRPRPLPQT